jgi:hypothetical protein
MIELVRFQSANYSNYYLRFAIDDDTVSVIKCATNSISVDGDNVKSSRCSLVTPTVSNYVSGIVFTAITNKQYDLYLQVSTDQETWTNFSQTNLTFYNNGTEYIGCVSSSLLFDSYIPSNGEWGSDIENGITIISTHENIVQNDTVLTAQQWLSLIASDPKEYIWKIQSPNGKIYHIRDAEAKEILDNLETFEVDVDSHVLHINGDSAAGSGSTHTYSTTEQVVGTWIDGKLIYECTYELNNISCRSGAFTSTGINRSGIDTFIQGFLLDTGGSATETVRQCFQCVGIGNVGDYIGVLCYFTNSPREMQYLTIQYTKTTD